MSLTEAIKGLIVVVAVLFGATSNAFAHAGHAHAQSPATSNVASSSLSLVTPNSVAALPHVFERFSSASALPSSVHARAPVNSVQSVQSSPNYKGGAACSPGACCCQGASSCGMAGHCCSMMPEYTTWTNDLSDHMRYHLARLGWVYPDIVIGLDRPPKA